MSKTGRLEDMTYFTDEPLAVDIHYHCVSMWPVYSLYTLISQANFALSMCKLKCKDSFQKICRLGILIFLLGCSSAITQVKLTHL